MSQHDDKRRRLLGRLSRQFAYTAPVLALVAGGAALQATAGNTSTEAGFAPVSEAALLLASSNAVAEGEAEGEAEAGSSAEVRRPDGYTPDYSETDENPQELLARGEELYYDTSLSTNGLSCASCHGSDGDDVGYKATFEQPFPHQVAMASSQFGMPEVHADEMVQVCMVAPMAAEPLEWGGEKLTSLAAYMVEVQKRFAGEPHDL
ncbi:cytochrome-c peroxidase [Halomonas sp. EGI 63088]|uniref:Cytochrome-c peroxidase n=1 Tax=Halomonas flagellata TaxID=2920385 RepID=A0ABS9RRA8_9GAMM|nr:cytochrome-c peroxidase [Halomonas flagellata]MCH4562391.1 cytochrome-c peroxidase [Halomonas flagellata]